MAVFSCYLLGGYDINPSEMLESFNETETHSFSFHPGGYIETGVCGHSSDNGALHWDDTSGLKYATSQQLIVQENFMLQFKVLLIMVCLHWQGQRKRSIKMSCIKLCGGVNTV